MPNPEANLNLVGNFLKFRDELANGRPLSPPSSLAPKRLADIPPLWSRAIRVYIRVRRVDVRAFHFHLPSHPTSFHPTHQASSALWRHIRNRASSATLSIPATMSASWLSRKRKSELLELAQQANLPEYVHVSSIHVQTAAGTDYRVLLS